MRGRTLLFVLSLGVAWSCSGRRERPPLPAPEYERHAVAPYDAGAPVDPLDDDAGEWLDFEEEGSEAPPPAKADPAAPGDAGAPAEAGAAGDAGSAPDAAKGPGGRS